MAISKAAAKQVFTIEQKTFHLDAQKTLEIKEQFYFDVEYEGLRVWESGIVMARHYALMDARKFEGETVVELGSGTGIAGLAIAKYTQAAKVIFTDYKEPILDIIRDNIELMGKIKA